MTPNNPPGERAGIFRRIRQLFCSHAVYYDTDMTSRDANGNVSCPCYKCGKVLVADCGLRLGAALHRRNKL